MAAPENLVRFGLDLPIPEQRPKFEPMAESDDSFFIGKDPGLGRGGNSAFSTTHWSVVLGAGQDNAAGAAAALERLCSAYWYPIYAFIRRRGSDRHEAEDLTQAFFAYFLEKEPFKKVDRRKGKFRSFLLAAVTNFLANEWDKLRTLKRGGACRIVPLDEVAADELYSREEVDSVTPERLFDRRWASALVEQVLGMVGREYAAAGKDILFGRLRAGLTGELEPGTVAAWAAELGMTEGAVRVAVHRLRRRFGELLRNEISATVESDAEVNEEIRHLFAAISS